MRWRRVGRGGRLEGRRGGWTGRGYCDDLCGRSCLIEVCISACMCVWCVRADRAVPGRSQADGQGRGGAQRPPHRAARQGTRGGTDPQTLWIYLSIIGRSYSLGCIRRVLCPPVRLLPSPSSCCRLQRERLEACSEELKCQLASARRGPPSPPDTARTRNGEQDNTPKSGRQVGRLCRLIIEGGKGVQWPWYEGMWVKARTCGLTEARLGLSLSLCLTGPSAARVRQGGHQGPAHGAARARGEGLG